MDLLVGDQIRCPFCLGPIRSGEPENPEVRLLLVEIANDRAPQCQHPGTDQVLVDLVARARKANES